MQVKVFEADDMKSALRQVKETLGPDALILSTRTVRKGGLGVLAKPRLEITAAVETPPSEKRGEERRADAALPGRAPAAEEEISYSDIWKRRPVLDSPEEALGQHKGRISPLDLDSLRGEILDLKKMVREVASAAPRNGNSAAGNQPAADSRDRGWVGSLAELLTDRGLEREAVETVVRTAMSKLSPRQKEDPEVLRAFARQVVAHMLKVSGPIGFKGGAPRRVALVGPTGVGKTTTIAKLAADHMLSQRRRVALVTIDIYRIAAAEQLKVYGEIMDLPVEVVISPEQLQKVLAKHRDKELILIDTAGRSPKDGLGLEELEAFLGPDSGVENHLVLSATTRERELYSAVERFSRLPIRNLIFTKLDECESLGALLNVQLKCNFPISYVTNGQRVPEDLMLAEPKRVSRLIMGSH